jgi:hypothetical protein
MTERRSLVRHRTLIKGRIYFNNRLASMDCIVRDLAAGGGRLEFSENVTLPESFELYIPNKDEYFNAHVQWRKGKNLGISWSPELVAKQRGEQGRPEQTIADRVTKLEHDFAVLQKRLDALQARSPIGDLS